MKTLTLLFGISVLTCAVPLPAKAVDLGGGGQVLVTGKLQENLYAFGRRVMVDVHAVDDVYLAGGTVAFRGRAEQSVLAAGREVNLDNAIIRELVVAGGRVSLGKVLVYDDLVAAANQLHISPLARINGTARLTGREVVINGAIYGNVEVRAASLKLGPNASIHGNLSYRANSFSRAQGATIIGITSALPANRISPFWWLAAAVFLLGSLFVAPTLALLFRRTVAHGSELIHRQFWRSLGRGALVALLLPVGLGILLFSLIGTPLAIALVPGALFGAAIAWATAVFFLGSWIRAVATRRQAEVSSSAWGVFGWTLLASVIASALSLVPVLGQVFAVFMVCIGAGGLYTYLRGLPAQRPREADERWEEVA